MVQGPLYRVKVLQRSADDQLLVLCIHHAIADGWSLGTFVRDLCEAHARGKMGVTGGLTAPRLTYSAWGAVERGFWQPEIIGQRLPFWQSCLVGGQRLWTTPVSPQAMENPLRKWVSRVSAELGRASREFARSQGATLFTVLLTAFRIPWQTETSRVLARRWVIFRAPCRFASLSVGRNHSPKTWLGSIRLQLTPSPTRFHSLSW
jgi:Condensation domain